MKKEFKTKTHQASHGLNQKSITNFNLLFLRAGANNILCHISNLQ
jgi:hypothetical protein